MKELSLHILDIAQNSISAGARALDLTLAEENGWLTITVADDGRGMSPEFLATVTDPFTTTRTTRKVGLGLPLLRLAAEQTGGQMKVDSRLGEGTTVTAAFDTASIDCPRWGTCRGPSLYWSRVRRRAWRSPIPEARRRAASGSTPGKCGRSWGRTCP